MQLGSIKDQIFKDIIYHKIHLNIFLPTAFFISLYHLDHYSWDVLSDTV